MLVLLVCARGVFLCADRLQIPDYFAERCPLSCLLESEASAVEVFICGESRILNLK